MFYALGGSNPEFKSSDTFYGVTSDGNTKCFRVFCNTYKCSCIPNISEVSRNQLILESYNQRNYKPEVPIEEEATPFEVPQSVANIDLNTPEEKSWQFAAEFIGQDAVARLRSGGYMDINASNGKIYRLTGDAQVYDLTSKYSYCVHPSNENEQIDFLLPKGDKVALLSQWLKYRPYHVETITGGAHRRPCSSNEPCWE